MLEKIVADETSHKAWDILGKDKIFRQLKWSVWHTIRVHWSCYFYSKQHKALGDDIKEFYIVMKILWAMTSKYETIVCMLAERNSKGLSLDEIYCTLLVHEKIINSYDHMKSKHYK